MVIILIRVILLLYPWVPQAWKAGTVACRVYFWIRPSRLLSSSNPHYTSSAVKAGQQRRNFQFDSSLISLHLKAKHAVSSAIVSYHLVLMGSQEQRKQPTLFSSGTLETPQPTILRVVFLTVVFLCNSS